MLRQQGILLFCCIAAAIFAAPSGAIAQTQSFGQIAQEQSTPKSEDSAAARAAIDKSGVKQQGLPLCDVNPNLPQCKNISK